jgi:hypothetical protein
MARARTIGPDAPSAWTKRAPMSASIVGAKVHAALAMRNRPRPNSRTGLRPMRSETGP